MQVRLPIQPILTPAICRSSLGSGDKVSRQADMIQIPIERIYEALSACQFGPAGQYDWLQQLLLHSDIFAYRLLLPNGCSLISLRASRYEQATTALDRLPYKLTSRLGTRAPTAVHAYHRQ